MARTSDPGISYYQMKCDHIHHRKIRLLVNEFGPQGYWVWSCILSELYKNKGYYFETNNLDDLEVFAVETCKVSLTRVQEIIAGCVRRSLFDKPIFDNYGVLTSDSIQEFYIWATKDRRKKTSLIFLNKAYLIIEISCDEKNITIIPGSIPITHGSNDENKGSNTHKIRQDSIRQDSISLVDFKSTTAPPPKDELFSKYESEIKTLPLETTEQQGVAVSTLKDFIKSNGPAFIEPYVMLWNLFARKYEKAQLMRLTKIRKTKFKKRIQEESFDFTEILSKAKASTFLIHKWPAFTFDWIIENESNYLKILEGAYDDGKPVSDKKQTTNDGVDLLKKARENAAKLV